MAVWTPPATSQASALAIVGRMAPASPASKEMLALLSGPLGQAIETAATFADGRLAASTRRAYERDWRGFAEWCRSQKVDPTALPVHPVLVAAYLASLVPALGKSGLQARLAAIAHHHHEKGHLWSARHPAITGYAARHPTPAWQTGPSRRRPDLHRNPPTSRQLWR